MDRQELIYALTCPKDEFERYRLLALKSGEPDKTVTLRAIIEYSNICKRHCAYCGLNACNNTLTRYRMSPEEIVKTAAVCKKAGYISVVLQGGEDDGFGVDALERVTSEIAATGLIVTLSSGELKTSDYERLFRAGATRYLLKHETANPDLYAALHPDGTLKARLECFNELKRIGYAAGGGFMVGLPEQTAADIADDLMLLKAIDADMAGIGTFIPHSATPLKEANLGDKDLTLRAVALARILMPKANIPATTSLSVAANDKYLALDYGADVIMLKATPTKYRRLYEIYMASDKETDISGDRQETVRAIKAKGYSCI